MVQIKNEQIENKSPDCEKDLCLVVIWKAWVKGSQSKDGRREDRQWQHEEDKRVMQNCRKIWVIQIQYYVKFACQKWMDFIFRGCLQEEIEHPNIYSNTKNP